MTIDQAIISKLLADTDIETLVGDKIYTTVGEQGVSIPAIVVTQVSEFDNVITHSGSAGLCRSRFRFSCLGITQLQAKQIARAIKTVFHGLGFTSGDVIIAIARAENLIDSADIDQGFMSSLDVVFQHNF